jgi:glycosyltransferase 2 family protein
VIETGRTEHAVPTDVVRSPSDVLRFVVAAVLLLALLLVQWLWGETLVTFASELFQGLSALPSWIVGVVVAGTRVLAVVVLVGGLVFAARAGGRRMLGTAAVAAAVAAPLELLLERLGPDAGETAVDVPDALGPLLEGRFPTTAGLGAAVAAVTAAAPWLSRRARRVSWLFVMGLVVTYFLATPASFDSVQALLVGWVAGAAALVVLGAPSRRPTLATVTAGLAAVGVPLASLDQASVDARGSTPYFGATTDGQKLFVKALGEDQRSADLLFRAYRWIDRRDRGDERPFSSLRRTVEHEALVALAAREHGIRTPRLVAFATAEPHSFVLAYEAVAGRSLDRVAPEEVTDGVLAAIWAQVGQLRRHRIAHRDLRLANIFLAEDGEVWLIDFGFSELAASDTLLATDIAELVASSSLQVGADRAVAQAHRALTPAELEAASGRLHLWALSGATRTGLKDRAGLIDEVRRGLDGQAELHR